MKPTKENAMLLNVEYMRPNRKTGTPDYLYIVWKDLDTGEKHLMAIPEPKSIIYFEKPEYRNHSYNRNYAKMEEVVPKVVKYKDIIFEIANDMGDVGRNRLNEIFTMGDYKALNEFYIYPYVFGADIDVCTFYRNEWLTKLDNDRVKPITEGFLDIEVDSFEAVGFPTPDLCPIDLVTIIDKDTRDSYTFALVGVECVEKDMTGMTAKEKENELKRREMYAHRLQEQEYYMEHTDLISQAVHDTFDENYPGMEYHFFFYKDERKMLIHIFQLINKLKKDFMEIWNLPFDGNYFVERMRVLGLDPAEVMCHPDFPVKECWFKKDTINFMVKNKADYLHVSSYTVFTDQMRNYAAIRKGGSELRSTRLSYIAKKEIGDEKLDYSEVGNIKTLSYIDWLMYIIYNIKDVLLQMGIAEKTSDIQTFYQNSYLNLTSYEKEFKQTVVLRNVQYNSYLSQGLVPGENVNGFLTNYKEERELDDYDEDEEDEDEEDTSAKKKKKKVGFEGALVGNPLLIDKFGEYLYGKRTNNIFSDSIDFDMSAFYPSTIRACNIDPSTLIFKMILDSSQFDVRGGKLPYHGITNAQMVEENGDSFTGDIAKEVMDNFQTRNYISFGYKWLNLPSITQVYKRLVDKFGGKK